MREGIGALLVDITGMTGFPPPSTTERFVFATRWAATAGGKVIASFLSRPELIDPEKIGMTMANNRGLRANVFTEEFDAVAWLLSELRR